MNSRRAWLVYGIGVFAYVVAVAQRSSLGVAGVAASERFDIAAAALSTLAIVQLFVYAGLQIPVGMLIDRVGPKRLLVIGAALMMTGQLVLALSPAFAGAVAGRLLVGAGDAMTFVPMSRLVVSWFSGRIVPQVTQGLGTLGQLGQVVSAVPLALAIRDWGWSPAFLSVAALSALAGVLLVVWLRDAPAGTPHARADLPSLRQMLGELVEGIRRPGTQFGFWSHFLLQAPSNTLLLLWGYPLFSVGMGFGAATASLLLVVMVVAATAAGPLIGLASSRFPHRRGTIVLGLAAAMALSLAGMLLWPGIPPLWFVIVVVVVLATGGPASLLGLDIARGVNPLRSLGAVLGVVNVGGFLATVTVLLVVGLVLDGLDRAVGGTGVPAELYAFDRFRIALVAVYLVCGGGTLLMLRARRRTRLLAPTTG